MTESDRKGREDADDDRRAGRGGHQSGGIGRGRLSVVPDSGLSREGVGRGEGGGGKG